MKIQIQWTTLPATGWQWIDSSEWPDLPAKPEPVGGEIINDTPGWIFGLNVQGVLFTYDHYSVRDLGPNVEVACWNDDPDDWDPLDRYGHIWVFRPVEANTDQTQEIFGAANHRARLEERFPGGLQSTGGPVGIRSFNQFRYPPARFVKHGIWVTHTLAAAHTSYDFAGWEEWR